MRRIITLALAPLLLFSACTDDEQVRPRPMASAEDLVGQSHMFKVASDAWQVSGTPGDDTYGYMAFSSVDLITDAIITDGRVNLYIKRANNNWAELPISALQGAPGGVNWRFVHSPGIVRILIDRNGESFSAPDETMVFKAVVFAN